VLAYARTLTLEVAISAMEHISSVGKVWDVSMVQGLRVQGWKNAGELDRWEGDNGNGIDRIGRRYTCEGNPSSVTVAIGKLC
jgi:hypothetical protein